MLRTSSNLLEFLANAKGKGNNDNPKTPLLVSLEEEITDALLSNKVRLLESGGSIWEIGNSVVLSTPRIFLSKIFEENQSLEAALNFVFISGPVPENEELHFHTSHIIAYVVSGRGWFLHSDKKIRLREANRIPIRSGNLIVLPKGYLHTFECDVGDQMVYAAVEYANVPIDYQKHHC